LLLEHNRLKGQNQSLECELREANAELRTATETQFREKRDKKYAQSSPVKKNEKGERERFGSGQKNNSQSRNRF